MALTSQIEAADRDVKPPVGSSGRDTESVLAMPARSWDKAEADRLKRKEHRALGMVIAAANLTHPCQLDKERGVTTCDHPGHARDAENTREMLEALGLVPTRRRTSKECTACGDTYPLSAYRAKGGTPDGLDTRCSPCIRASVKERS